MKKVCDSASVGVIVQREAADGQAEYLLLTRATPPVGVAPAAGHVFDEHAQTADGRALPCGHPDIDETASYRAAALAEVEEELGLQASGLALVASGWRTAACRRQPGPRGIGHEWRVYRATATGTLAPSERETHGARWYRAEEVQQLADRTIATLYGHLTWEQFTNSPGIEPVWVRWLTEAGIVHIDADALEDLEHELEHRSLRGSAPGRGVTVRIDHDIEDGGTQQLWAEVADWEQLERFQALTRAPDAADSTISLAARLAPDGPDLPRTFRAHRLRLTEVEDD